MCFTGCSGDEFSSGRTPPGDSGGTGARAGEAGTPDAGEGSALGGTGGSAQGGSAQAGSAQAGENDGGQGGGTPRCNVECCDGSLLVQNYPDAAACFSIGAENCGADGPRRADFEGESWTPSVMECPTNRDCNLTCCNGEERARTTFDDPLCVSAARVDSFCRERGGLERVEFDGTAVWEDDECALGDFNCVSTCCDGSRSYTKQALENECSFYGMYACEDDGGPSDIAFEGRDVFTPDVECPTARSCILECCDGFEYDRSPSFGVNVCVYFNAGSSVCADEAHGGNKQVVFGGDVIWVGTCP